MSVIKWFTLCSHQSLPSVHGRATCFDHLTKTKRDWTFLTFLTMRQYSLSMTGQWSFYDRGAENRSLAGSESVAYLGTFPWSIEDLTVSYSGKDMFTSSSHAVMQDVLCSVKSEYPNVTKAYFQQDITGCSHSLPTILACPVVSGSPGVQIRRIDFSNPQGRKGAADCLPATCKAHVRIFINEGHDVTNATQLKDTLVSHGGIDGVRVVCLDAITMASPISEPAKIQNVSKLNNFEFTEGGIKAWSAYGRGKQIKAYTLITGNAQSWSFCFCCLYLGPSIILKFSLKKKLKDS